MIKLKLIDFLMDPSLNMLRFQMGAKLVLHNGGTRTVKLLDEEAIRRLGKEGIDVDFGDVKVEPDKTLSFKGKRVVLYIRDIPIYKDKQSLPRFHISYCRTLEEMRRVNRWTRYVVATRDDGKFQVNLIDRSARPSIQQLNVCQNCLDLLAWEGFSYNNMRKADRAIVKGNFLLATFFVRYPKDLISVIPTYDAEVAPINDYPEDWGLISERIKKERGYQCASCGISLIGSDRQYLHVHHKNGQKNISNGSNLEVLCIRCHADEPMHSHMKGTAGWREFEAKFGIK